MSDAEDFYGKIINVVFKLPHSYYLPCYIYADFPSGNPRRRTRDWKVYTSLRIQIFRNEYLTAGSSTIKGNEFTAQEGAIMRLYYHTGSARRTYYQYEQFFVVGKSDEKDLVLKDQIGNEHLTAKVKNLIPFDKPSAEKIKEIEAEILNKYKVMPSQYDPVAVLYWAWIIERKHEIPKVVLPRVEETSLEEQEKKINELEEKLKSI